MIRLITFATSGGGYLNFMGNEFGHPEWIDFPREGNNWSYKYARRQWNLAENPDLKYQFLSGFDREMMKLQQNPGFLEDRYINRIYENTHDKVIAFTRGKLLFVFNFHPNSSFTDYGIPIKGKFRIILDSDAPEFGGFDRIDRNPVYSSSRRSEMLSLNVPFYLYLYLPARTALVFRTEQVKRATDI
jgi:1,4-alpha-glucan branching enzyme